MSSLPYASYTPPSWVTSLGPSPFVQRTSPYNYNSMALIPRPRSSLAIANPNMPLLYSPATNLRRSISGSGYQYGRGLSDRPSEWRRDFSVRTGLASILPRSRRQSSVSRGGKSLFHYEFGSNLTFFIGARL